MSVQAQESFHIRVTIYQTEEQMINIDAKTSGGLKSFCVDSSAILKWTLNRKLQSTSLSGRCEQFQFPTESQPQKEIVSVFIVDIMANTEEM